MRKVNELLGNIFPDNEQDNLVGTWEIDDLHGQRSINVIKSDISSGRVQLIDKTFMPIDELITKWTKVEDISSPYENASLQQFSNLKIDEHVEIEETFVDPTATNLRDFQAIARVERPVIIDAKQVDPKVQLFASAVQLSVLSENVVTKIDLETVSSTIDITKLRNLIEGFDIPLDIVVVELMNSEAGFALVNDLLTAIFSKTEQ